MSDPGFTRSDLCSIGGAVGLAESADADRSLLGADGYPQAGDGPHAPLTRDVVRTLFEAGVLRTFGYLDRHRGTGGNCHVTGHRGQRTEAGR